MSEGGVSGGPRSFEAETQAGRGVEYARVKSVVRGSLFGGSNVPLRIGRFTVLERLGQGGMSIVYAAYDDELDRKVALKLLRPELAKRHAAERLRREAQAIARLSHPNVIPVYEVGEHDGRVFIAMEFVRGRTLREWMAGEARPWSEVADVLLQAAAGLAAAHREGIVHRDFKPDNVMLDDDGRVRVLDFGVAALEMDEIADTLSGDDSWSARLTQDGALIGTPAYMAPECLSRKPANILSDQFSLCGVCFEALVGRRPFDGETIAQLEASAAAGATFPPDVPVPAAVRAALMRGLSSAPDERFADMDTLVAALRPGPRRRWLRPTLVLGAAASGLAGWGLLPAPDTCESDAAEAVWNEATEATAREALLAGDVSLADWDAATQELDAHAAAWRDNRTESCTFDESGERELQRALCFEWLLEDLQAIVEPLVQGHAHRVAGTPHALERLPDPAACLDDDAIAELGDLRRRKSAPAPAGLSGLLSNFEEDPLTRFGAGWSPSTAVLAGGESTGKMTVVEGGHGSEHALRLEGEVRGEHPALRSGALVFLGDRHFAPANLRDVDALTFWAKATPGSYAVMAFTSRSGFNPTLVDFVLSEDQWQLVEVDLDAMIPERYDVTGIFIGRVQPGEFEMLADDVGFE